MFLSLRRVVYKVPDEVPGQASRKQLTLQTILLLVLAFLDSDNAAL